MPDPITGLVVGSSLITGYMSSNAQSDAANKASGAQLESAQLGIEEQRRQFDAMRALLQPYTDMGKKSLNAQGDLAGLNGPGAQEAAIKAIENSPMFQSMTQQGENAILQNASATGGLRGGNVQGALGQFRSSALSEAINAEYSRLGGLTGIGQASAAGVGAAGIQTGQNISGLYGEQGAAIAGNALAQGQIAANQWGNINSQIGIIAGRSGF